jgi:hypothetical protein
VSAAVALPDESPWLIRPYDPATDEDGMMYMLGVGYARSRAGVRAGASQAGGSRTKAERDAGVKDISPNTRDAQRAFMLTHRFIFAWLLQNADVLVAVDREKPTDRIWAWLVTTGDVIHAVGCKRSLIAEKLSADIIRDLLGVRLAKHQVCSLELPQMRTRGAEAIGIDRPSSWSMDPTWLLTRIPSEWRGDAGNFWRGDEA